MKIPTIFKGKVCTCGKTIDDESVKEVGIDLNTEQYVLRFSCSDCGLNGRLVFQPNLDAVNNPFSEVFDMKDSNKKKSEKDKKNKISTKEEIFSANFDQNKIGCLFIPAWTEESAKEFDKSMTNNLTEKD